LHRAALSAFTGARALVPLRTAAREFARRPEGHVQPLRPEPAPEPWRSPYPVGTVLTTSDGLGRGSLVVKAVDEARRTLECQDSATGRRSTVTLS
jgi:hypothetical protein